MIKQIEAMKLALEALDELYLPGEIERVNKAITALREALAEQFCDTHCTWLDHHPDCDKAEQPAQLTHNQKCEGVKAMLGITNGELESLSSLMFDTYADDVERVYEALCTTPQPPAQREWVGLTQEEIDLVWDSVPETQFWWRHYAQAIEAKLKAKNERKEKNQ
jgi:hypothetical protein